MSKTQSFMDWVSDPARTNDELFTVELLLETARGVTKWPFSYVDASFEAKQTRARERKLNPAYRPSLHRDELLALQEHMVTYKHFSGAWTEDRPVRDLQALCFFPELNNVNVQSSDVTDLSPLAALRKVQRLSIAEYGDLYGCQPLCLAQCGEMPALTYLHLALRHPWPDLRGMANWLALTDISFNGNVLALEEVTRLPAIRNASLKQWATSALALRDLQKLPEMPRAKQLILDSVASLEGIERYPSVVNLEVHGCFRDLTPLAAMGNITAVTLQGEKFQDLRPLTRMAKLREIKFVREWPLDLSPLADCAQLRRVSFEHCAMMRTEVSALNAGLLPEASDFEAAEPRPVPPLKFYRIAEENKEASNFFNERRMQWHAAREKFYDGDLAFQKAEMRVHYAALQAKFDELLGRGWGMFTSCDFIPLKRFPDTVRLPELIQILREYSARSRFPIPFSFIVQPHGDMSEDLEQMKEREEAEQAPDEDYLAKYYEPDSLLEENEEDRRLRQERYELLKREHLLRLRDEDELDPALLYLPKEEPEPAAEAEEDEEEPLTSSADEEDEGEGGVAIAPPPPAPPETQDLSEELMFYIDIYEDCVKTNGMWADRAQYHLGVPFVPWESSEVPGES